MIFCTTAPIWKYLLNKSANQAICGTFHSDLSQTKEETSLHSVESEERDQLRVKKALYAHNACKDKHFEETEERSCEGYKEYKLVKLGKEDSCFSAGVCLLVMIICS